MYMYVVCTLWKYPDMDIPVLSRLKNGAGKQYRVVAVRFQTELMKTDKTKYYTCYKYRQFLRSLFYIQNYGLYDCMCLSYLFNYGVRMNKQLPTHVCI